MEIGPKKIMHFEYASFHIFILEFLIHFFFKHKKTLSFIQIFVKKIILSVLIITKNIFIITPMFALKQTGEGKE